MNQRGKDNRQGAKLRPKGGLTDRLEPLVLIVNPEAAGKKWQRTIKARRSIEACFEHKIQVASGSKEGTVDLVKKIAPNAKTVIAVGGDGTIADVLEGLKKANCLERTIFGIIPLGSGNAFRHAFGIPKKIDKAIKIIEQGKIRLIDLIAFEDKVAGFLSVGATAEVTEEKIKQGLPGFWGHIWAGRKLLKMEPQKWQIILEDGVDDYGLPFSRLELELEVLEAVVAKTNYFGYSWLIAPLAQPDDGWLDITFFPMSGGRYVLSLPAIYFGRKQRSLPHYKARCCTIQGENLAVQYNGEFLGWRKEITFTVKPKALQLICPSPRK